MLRAVTLAAAAVAALGTAGCVGTPQILQPGQAAYGYQPYYQAPSSYASSGPSRPPSGGGGGGFFGRSQSNAAAGLPFGYNPGASAVLFGGI